MEIIEDSSELKHSPQDSVSNSLSKTSLSDEIFEEDEEKLLRCLIANDDPMQLHVLKTLFEMLNFEVITALNGAQAYELVQVTLLDVDQSDRYFDLIVLDLNMPIADGYEACKNILKLF